MKTSFPQTWKQRRLDDLDIPRASPPPKDGSFLSFYFSTGKGNTHARKEEGWEEDEASFLTHSAQPPSGVKERVKINTWAHGGGDDDDDAMAARYIRSTSQIKIRPSFFQILFAHYSNS